MPEPKNYLVFLEKYDGNVIVNVNFGAGRGVNLSKDQITERASKGGFSNTLHSFYTPESVAAFLQAQHDQTLPSEERAVTSKKKNKATAANKGEDE